MKMLVVLQSETQVWLFVVANDRKVHKLQEENEIYGNWVWMRPAKRWSKCESME